jgi:hypothetical protein
MRKVLVNFRKKGGEGSSGGGPSRHISLNGGVGGGPSINIGGDMGGIIDLYDESTGTGAGGFKN